MAGQAVSAAGGSGEEPALRTSWSSLVHGMAHVLSQGPAILRAASGGVVRPSAVAEGRVMILSRIEQTPFARLLASLLIGSIPGIVIGSTVAGKVNDALVRYALAVMLVISAIKMIWS